MACEEEQSYADVLRRASCPVVFSGLINHWSSLHWTPSHLAQVLQGKTYRCKVAPRKSTEKVWETDCAHIEASLADFADWTAGKTRGGNPLCHVSLKDFSCYVDYKYMSDMFEDCSDLLKSVDWSVFGLSGRDGQDSTIWIGSGGASTPCHYDTYGYNLVAQIHGRKRWHLFPPSSTKALCPTRLPYEESSVFSEVNVGQPDLSKHPLFKESQAVVVTLEPGQVLYVPRHWWHYVECLRTAISINTWVDVPSDDESRLSESVTRATISCLVNSDMGAHLEHWINPGEQIMPMDVNLTYVERCLHSQADRSVSDNPKANGIASKDNLHKFLQHFKTKQFDMVHAPWHIPGGASIAKMRQHNRDTCLHDQARVRGLKRHKMSVNHSEVEMNNLKRKKTNEKCIAEIPGVVHKENIDDRNLDDWKKARLASGPLCEFKDSVQSTCGIFALQTSCFDTYFNLVHESRTKVIDSVGGSEVGDIQDMVGIGDEDTVSLLIGNQSEGDTMASVSATHQTEGDTSASVTHQTESDTSASVSATHQTESDTSASVSATHQTEGDTSVSVSATHQTEGDTSVSVSATHQTESDTSVSVSVTHQTEGDTSVSVSATHQTESDTSASVSATHQTEGDTNVSVSATHQTESDTSVSVSATHQTEGDTSVSVSATHQTEGDTSVSVSATHQTESDTSASVSATHQTEGDTSVKDSAETQESESVDHETLDLSTMKEIFFRSLLHPRVMKAFEEELTKNYKSLMK